MPTSFIAGASWPRGGDTKTVSKTGEFIALPLAMAPALVLKRLKFSVTSESFSAEQKSLLEATHRRRP